MATYTVQGPSGKTYTIEGPDGATADQLGAHILQASPDERRASQAAADRVTYAPTVGMSTTDRTLAGIGSGMTSVLRAVGGGSLAEKLGLPATKDESESNDAALMNTTAGKVGRGIGQAAAVAPAVFVPGANTYGGAALLGGVLGAGTTEGDLGDRAKGAAFGVAGGVAGKGLGDLIGAGVSKVVQYARNSAATRQAANVGRDLAADNARAAGYVLPPTEINPTMLNSALEGLSGKIKTSQAASGRNQSVTNDLAKRELGLPVDAPITLDALKAVRANAGKSYDAAANLGAITPDASYAQALDAIVASAKKAQTGFPSSKPNPLVGEIDALRIPQGGSVDAASVISKIRELRASADTAYAGSNKELGAALKSGANALEDVVDGHLTRMNAPLDVLKNFRDARQTIAKTYSVEKALNPTTGDVSAQALAGQLKRGKPLSGDLRTVAEAGQAFPKATQALPQNYNAVSPLDYLAGMSGSMATGNPLMALATLARPAVRSAVLSGPYQRMAAGGRNYNPNVLAELLDATRGARRIAPVAGAMSVAPANQ